MAGSPNDKAHSSQLPAIPVERRQWTDDWLVGTRSKNEGVERVQRHLDERSAHELTIDEGEATLTSTLSN